MKAASLTTEFAGKQHHHGCTSCNRRYVCACMTPAENGVCNVCVSGRLPVWVEGWGPHECCYAAEPISPIWSKDELRTYRLVGPGPWYRCPTCSRQFPCQPSQVATGVPDRDQSHGSVP